LLAKLSAGDVIAQEFKYHPACLVALYNRERSAMRQEGESNIKDASLNDIVLAELVSYIFETQRNSKESVVLVSMYQERLSQVLASS
jgi:LPS O-antigen subunit length determinant protein (WzzB/FepE family)